MIFYKKNCQIYRLRKPSMPVHICCLLRVRNESLILHDTLEHLSKHCDAIVAYDDASTDQTFSILENCDSVVAIIRNYVWLPKTLDRLKCETKDRASLVAAAQKYSPTWFFCADADERFCGSIKEFLYSHQSQNIDGIRIQLFDAYMTPKDYKPFQRSNKLLNFRKYFGPERRDILMIWKNSKIFRYRGLDSREPKYEKKANLLTKFYCQHYGKSLSLQHWEDTCHYYLNHFPYDSYGKKWESRIGKAIHTRSDFNNELYEWGQALFSRSVKIHP